MQNKRPTIGARRTLRLFTDAVLAFSDDPGPANLERYLAASSALDESRRARRHRRGRRSAETATGEA